MNRIGGSVTNIKAVEQLKKEVVVDGLTDYDITTAFENVIKKQGFKDLWFTSDTSTNPPHLILCAQHKAFRPGTGKEALKYILLNTAIIPNIHDMTSIDLETTMQRLI
jgi:hypothetical protein